jgi:hypothetical protein
VFEVQAWLGLAVGGLLSFNLLFPTDEPSIPRLLGMWSIWMFTVPSLRAKECMPKCAGGGGGAGGKGGGRLLGMWSIVPAPSTPRP